MGFTHDFQMQFSAGGAETPFKDSITPEILLQAMKDQIAVYEESPEALLTDCEILNERGPRGTFTFRAVDNPEFCIYGPSRSWEKYADAPSQDGFLQFSDDLLDPMHDIRTADDGYFCPAVHMDKEPLVAVMTCSAFGGAPEYVDMAQIFMNMPSDQIQAIEAQGWDLPEDEFTRLINSGNPTAQALDNWLDRASEHGVHGSVSVEFHHSPRYLRNWMEANRNDVELAEVYDHEAAMGM